MLACAPGGLWAPREPDALTVADEQMRQESAAAIEKARLEQEARAAERQAFLQSADQRCRDGDDRGCADLLLDESTFLAAIGRSDTDLLQRGCNGGFAGACSVLEAEKSRASFGPQQLAALGRINELGDQWVQQISVLSTLRCAAGEEAKIESEWNGSAERRDRELQQLDEVMSQTGERWARTWRTQREFVDARVSTALARAKKCDQRVDDKDAAGLQLLLNADKPK